jgi:uncharacterized membrane protein YeiH
LTTLLIPEIVGTIAFALSGFLVATRVKLDLLGIFIASFLTALGGGVVRDVITNQVPYAFSHNLPIIIVILVITFALIFNLHKIPDFEKKSYFLISDTFGLVSFAISGALVAIGAEFNFTGVILLSVTTAVGGGVLRDMLINQIPIVLKSEFYATVAIVVAIGIYLCHFFDILSYVSIGIIFCIGFALRLLAYYQKWQLPTFQKESDERDT